MLAKKETYWTELKALSVAFVMMLGGFLLLAYLTLRPAGGGADVAAIFPPSMNLTEISYRLAALPFAMVRTGWTDTIVIVRPENKHASLDHLRSAGALVVMDAVASGGCTFLSIKQNIKGIKT